MDMLRSCYTVDMQFDEAGQIVRKVRWYFVPDDTPSFPYPQKFGSQVWQWRGLEPGGIGELATSVRKWSNGSVPWRLTQPHLCEHVPVEWFDQGCPSNAPDLVLTPIGQAACCAPANGIFVGVKLRARLLPPNRGGVTLKGRVRLARAYLVKGGLLPGGELVANPPYRVRGGVLVGATVKPKLIYHAKGGVLLTATKEAKSLLRGKGGTYQSGKKELFLIRPAEGGMRSSGKFDGLMKRKTKGGLRSGGKGAAILPCQPWVFTRHSEYVLYDVLLGVNWVLQNSGPLGNIWVRPSSPFFHIPSGNNSGTHCGAGTQMLLTFQDQFTNPPMILLSYNALTGTGLWQVPYSAHDYQGRLFNLTLPP